MSSASIIVRADWDDDAKVWVATSSDIDGLAVEAETMEALRDKVTNAICDLMELNGFQSDLSEIRSTSCRNNSPASPIPANEATWWPASLES